MKINEEIGEVLLSERSVLMLFWDKNDGWQVAGNGDLSIDAALLKNEGLEGLRAVVKDSDLGLFDAFLERVKENVEVGETVPSGTSSFFDAAFHLKTTDGSFRYHKIECHFKTDELGVVRKLLVRIPELEAEDVYRLHLAQVITNDKNPSFFNQEARAIMDSNPDKNFALIQFDVAKFKMINEQFGEEFGDELLDYFIHTLKLLCGKDQLYVRLTADVFMLLTPFETKDDISRFVEYINSNLLGYKGIPYRLVFGVCRIRDKSANLRKFGDGAALARQSIKNDVLTHLAFYSDEMKESAKMHKFIEDSMENALQNHEFVMYLQPKYSISREKVIGAEALVRWVHPERGIIPPMEFVPLFEENGFILKMDAYIWEEACKAIRDWIDRGVEPVPISVNVSRRHLKDRLFVDILNNLTHKYGIPKHLLEIEITETIEEAAVKEGILSLKESGYTLLMDDFGSGYSSLNMLKDTQFDVIKIDRIFLQDFISSERGRNIVEHTIRMTRAIGLDLVAEGVETKEQAMFLSSCGCDMAQGFYYAKPMTLADFNMKYSVG